MARINYRQQKQLREQGKKKRNDEKLKRKQKPLEDTTPSTQATGAEMEINRER